MKRLIFLLFVTCIQVTNGQNCYIQKDDLTGVKVNKYLPTLEKAACDLKNKLPLKYQNELKVYSYSPPAVLGGQTINALNTYINSFVSEAKETKNFYLLIIKMPLNGEINSQFHVELNLPNKLMFSCLNETKIDLIRLQIQASMEFSYNSNGRDPFKYELAEIEGMKTLGLIIDEIEKGNCEITPKNLKKYFEQLGFLAFECSIKKGLKPSRGDQERGSFIEDFANLDLLIDGQEIEIHGELLNYITEQNINGSLINGYITKNENFADSQFDYVKNKIKKNDIWLHIGYDTETQKDYLFIKASNIRWIVSLHYQLTLTALIELKIYDIGNHNELLAHYTSIFADHPTGIALKGNNLIAWTKGFPKLEYKGTTIDYSATAKSQDTSWDPETNKNDYNYNIWHSMRSVEEKAKNSISMEKAMERGMTFGWNKIWEAAKKQNLALLEKNTIPIEDFGQGIHALQDAFAHRGIHLVELENGIEHVKNDYNTDQPDYQRALNITKAAIFIYLLISKDYNTLDQYFSSGKISPLLDHYDKDSEIFIGISSDLRAEIESKIKNYQENSTLPIIKIK